MSGHWTNEAIKHANGNFVILIPFGIGLTQFFHANIQLQNIVKRYYFDDNISGILAYALIILHTIDCHNRV